MSEGVSEVDLDRQLLEVARNPALRQAVYAKIGDYCHHCRNRLNSLKLSLYLAKQQASAEEFDRWSGLDGHYRELERKVEHIQRLCRPLTLARVRISFDMLIEDRRPIWAGLWEARHESLRLIPPAEPVMAHFDVDRIGHALDAVVAWRAEQGRSEAGATLAWWLEGGLVRVTWEESPGADPCPTSAETAPDSTWSLPWLARIVVEHDGHVDVVEHPGWKLELSWPSAIPLP